jgi:PAS domain S-box-containing protein
MTKVVRCPACGEVAGAPTCPSCGAESQAAEGDGWASERDKTAESRDLSAERRDRAAGGRDEQARAHEQAAIDREAIASDQDQAWSEDDQAASRIDQRAADADQQAADDEFAAGGDEATYLSGIRARQKTHRARHTAMGARDETSAARLRRDEPETAPDGAPRDRRWAAGDRKEAAGDRIQAAGDRDRAGRDREEALRNRTDAAAAAERAVEVLEAMSDAFFTLDSEWRFTYLNPQAEAALDRQRGELIGRNVWDEFPEKTRSRFYDQYQRALREQAPVRFEETWGPDRRTFEVRAHPVPDGLAVYLNDVTDARLLEERFRQAQRLEAIGRVTAGVAHDFNNILAAVRGFASVGLRASADPTIRQYFDEIDAAGRRAFALTQQLSAFTREQQLTPELVDLNEIVDGLSSLLQQLVPADIDLRLAFSPQPVPVVVDRSQLEQVLLNLVVNSRDAIDAPGTITVSTTSDVPPGVAHDVRNPSGWLQVTDTGCGIPEEVLPFIFDPFFTTKPPETGTGLGLATIYGIVSQSGGSILVDSTVGVGTTVSIALPAGGA